MSICTVFGTSVQDAVARSVSEGKILVVYVEFEQDAWAQQVFTEALLSLIKERAVGLRITKGTPECAMFEQVFGEVSPPSLFCCRVNEVVDVIGGDVGADEAMQRLRHVLEPSSEAATPSATVQTPSHSEQPVPQSVARPEVPTPVTGDAMPVSRPVASPVPSSVPTSTPPMRQATLKEQSAAVAARIHQQNQLKRKQQEREDRERIRRLLKADDDERKSRMRELKDRRASRGDADIEEPQELPELRDNIRRKKGESKCALSIRLLNGHALQHEFDASNSLNDVRTWLDTNRTDGDEPYCFHRTIPRVTFGVTDEEKSLDSLELTPRSALILKPFSSYVNAYSTTGSTPSGLLGRLFGGISSYWSGAPSQPVTESLEPELVASQSPDSSHYASPMPSPAPQLALDLSHPSSLSLSIDPHRVPVERPRTPMEGTQSPHILSRMNSGLNPNVRTFNNATPDERMTYNGNRVNLEDDH